MCRKGGEVGTGGFKKDESPLTAKGKQLFYVRGILQQQPRTKTFWNSSTKTEAKALSKADHK